MSGLFLTGFHRIYLVDSWIASISLFSLCAYEKCLRIPKELVTIPTFHGDCQHTQEKCFGTGQETLSLVVKNSVTGQHQRWNLTVACIRLTQMFSLRVDHRLKFNVVCFAKISSIVLPTRHVHYLLQQSQRGVVENFLFTSTWNRVFLKQDSTSFSRKWDITSRRTGPFLASLRSNLATLGKTVERLFRGTTWIRFSFAGSARVTPVPYCPPCLFPQRSSWPYVLRTQPESVEFNQVPAEDATSRRAKTVNGRCLVLPFSCHHRVKEWGQ